MAENVGPLPEGGSRVALMAQCVDRPRALNRIYPFPEVEAELLELHYFTKHFPDVPVCGFLAGGEYGMRAGENEFSEIISRHRVVVDLWYYQIIDRFHYSEWREMFHTASYFQYY